MRDTDYKQLFRRLHLEAYDLLYDCKRQTPSMEAALHIFREKFEKKAGLILISERVPEDLHQKMINFYQQHNWWVMGFKTAYKTFLS